MTDDQPGGLPSDILPRVCCAGPLKLHLFHRDARVGEAWLRLHPREFEVLWRLAETPGVLVTKRTLLSDVWLLEREPETNSVEVHVARLRRKLESFDLGWMVETGDEGGYLLRTEGVPGIFTFGTD